MTIEFGGTTFNVSAKNVAVLTVYGYVVYRQYCLFLRVTAQYTSVLNGACDVLLAPDDALADRFRDVPDVTQPFPPGIRRPSEIDKDGGSRRPDVEIPPRVPKDSPNPTNSNPTTPNKGPVPKGPSIDQFQDPNLDPQPEPQPRPKELPPFPDKCKNDDCEDDKKFVTFQHITTAESAADIIENGVKAVSGVSSHGYDPKFYTVTTDIGNPPLPTLEHVWDMLYFQSTQLRHDDPDALLEVVHIKLPREVAESLKESKQLYFSKYLPHVTDPRYQQAVFRETSFPVINMFKDIWFAVPWGQ